MCYSNKHPSNSQWLKTTKFVSHSSHFSITGCAHHGHSGTQTERSAVCGGSVVSGPGKECLVSHRLTLNASVKKFTFPWCQRSPMSMPQPSRDVCSSGRGTMFERAVIQSEHRGLFGEKHYDLWPDQGWWIHTWLALWLDARGRAGSD